MIQTRGTLDRELQQIHDNVLLMGARLERAIHNSIEALGNRDIELAQAIIARVEAFYLELDRCILETVGDLTDIYFIADDVGVQHGLMISPKMFRKFIKPSLT